MPSLMNFCRLRFNLQTPFAQLQGCCRQISTSSKEQRKYRPRRALMYVPGNDEKKLNKIPSLGADCIVMDCEDGVAMTRKAEARLSIRKVLDENTINFGKSERTVRVNSVDSGLCQEDISVILGARNLPTSINLPKVESADHIKWFLSKAEAVLQSSGVKPDEPINLIMFVESAAAILSLVNIVRDSLALCRGTNFVPDALVFGSDDYCASVGATRSNQADEIAYARQYMVTVAKAFQLQAIDIVYIDFKDPEGLRKQSSIGAAMGYTGKQVIHPSQVSICHEAFTPSSSKIEWAQELIKEFEKHQNSGQGAFTFRGAMIDMPLLLQARNIVELAKSLN